MAIISLIHSTNRRPNFITMPDSDFALPGKSDRSAPPRMQPSSPRPNTPRSRQHGHTRESWCHSTGRVSEVTLPTGIPAVLKFKSDLTLRSAVYGEEVDVIKGDLIKVTDYSDDATHCAFRYLGFEFTKINKHEVVRL